jgi:hypothetical protein
MWASMVGDAGIRGNLTAVVPGGHMLVHSEKSKG